MKTTPQTPYLLYKGEIKTKQIILRQCIIQHVNTYIRNNDLNSQKCKLTQVFCIFDSNTTNGSVLSDENYCNNAQLLVKLQVKQ